MNESTSRRGFLVAALVAAGGMALALGGLAGRAAKRVSAGIRIPFKRFERGRLHEPHDLAG